MRKGINHSSIFYPLVHGYSRFREEILRKYVHTIRYDGTMVKWSLVPQPN